MVSVCLILPRIDANIGAASHFLVMRTHRSFLYIHYFPTEGPYTWLGLKSCNTSCCLVSSQAHTLGLCLNPPVYLKIILLLALLLISLAVLTYGQTWVILVDPGCWEIKILCITLQTIEERLGMHGRLLKTTKFYEPLIWSTCHFETGIHMHLLHICIYASIYGYVI